MSNTRSVHTDALATLGTAPLDSSAKRDAIHIAVEPVVAGETLRPGDHITVEQGIARFAEHEDGLGIVDPFLTAPVRKGQRFWFLMYPRMVTSLRHVWAHPAFPDEEEPKLEIVAPPLPSLDEVRKATLAASERWLRDYIRNGELSHWSYEDVLKVALGGEVREGDGYTYLRHDGEYIISGGYDAHGEIDPAFWDHVEVVTGQRVNHRAEYFSCSC